MSSRIRDPGSRIRGSPGVLDPWEGRSGTPSQGVQNGSKNEVFKTLYAHVAIFFIFEKNEKKRSKSEPPVPKRAPDLARSRTTPKRGGSVSNKSIRKVRHFQRKCQNRKKPKKSEKKSLFGHKKSKIFRFFHKKNGLQDKTLTFEKMAKMAQNIHG